MLSSKKEHQIKFLGASGRDDVYEVEHKLEPRLNKVPPNLDGWLGMEFPYYAPEDELPAPLPTMEEIEAAGETEDNLTGWEIIGVNFVYRVSKVYAIKFSLFPNILQEAENMLYLQKHSQVRVPKVYAAFAHQGADPVKLLERMPYHCPDRSFLPKYYYLVMEYIPGKAYYHDEFDKLAPGLRAKICTKIGEQFRLLREVPQPSGPYYGRVGRLGFIKKDHQYVRYSGDSDDNVPIGPYCSYEEYLDALHKSALMIAALDRSNDEFTPRQLLHLHNYRDVLNRTAGKEPKLSHLDLKLVNVVVQEKEGTDDVDVVIIDWATLAWAPAYLEFAQLIFDGYFHKHESFYFWEMAKEMGPVYIETAMWISNCYAAIDAF